MQAMDNMNVIIEVLKIQETIAKAHEYFQNDELMMNSVKSPLVLKVKLIGMNKFNHLINT
jgi:hypothetical protein